MIKKDLNELFKGELTNKDIKLIPRSFDVVGDILIFSDFPKELKKKERIIGLYLLKKLKQVNVIAIKTKKYSGKFRTPKLKIIAGENRKEAIHKENGLILRLNVETCYFSPRLGTERLRISKLVKKNECVLVMFSGVAPYPLTISKYSKAKMIYCVEINKKAHNYAVINVNKNKRNNIKLFNGDVRKVLPKLNVKFDRILMPLPKGAEPYLDLAFSMIKRNGIIHFYDFLDQKDIPKIAIEKVKKLNKKIQILRCVKCGQLGPGKFRVCLDFKAL